MPKSCEYYDRILLVLQLSEKMQIVRIPYDIEAVQRKVKKGGLPSLLIERVSKGR
jgi:hypothetical protein